jgi:hypothetical protein
LSTEKLAADGTSRQSGRRSVSAIGGYRQVLQPLRSDVQPRPGRAHSGDRQTTPVQSAALAQVTSHAHDEPQRMRLHESGPEQSTLHRPAPQLTFSHACLPLQVIAQDVALVQLMPLRQASLVEQAMLQLQPAGQVRVRRHASGSSAQSIVQLRVSGVHDVHGEGQTFDDGPSSLLPASACAATQKPSTQLRPVLQSEGFSQANSSLR